METIPKYNLEDEVFINGYAKPEKTTVMQVVCIGDRYVYRLSASKVMHDEFFLHKTAAACHNANKRVLKNVRNHYKNSFSISKLLKQNGR